MLVEAVDDDIKRDVWKRDEFTCRYCGRTVAWEEVNLVLDIHPDKGGEIAPSNMLTVCSTCLTEGKTAPVEEKDKQKLLGIIRELVCYTDLTEEVIFEMDHEQEMERLLQKTEALKEDNRKLSSAVQEKERLAITYKQKMDRVLKDMENLRRRQETDIELRVDEGTRKVLMSMIETLDDLDRAIQEARKDKDVREVQNVISGLGMIRKALMDRLRSQGVQKLDPKGEIFDPNYHEAVSSVMNKKVLKGTVLEVRQPGFIRGPHLLRPAMVIISKGGKKPEKKEPEELEEFELDSETDEIEVLQLEPWTPDNDQEFVVKKPRKRKKRVIKGQKDTKAEPDSPAGKT
jgi:molecular chaperone GrpE